MLRSEESDLQWWELWQRVPALRPIEDDGDYQLARVVEEDGVFWYWQRASDGHIDKGRMVTNDFALDQCQSAALDWFLSDYLRSVIYANTTQELAGGSDGDKVFETCKRIIAYYDRQH